MKSPNIFKYATGELSQDAFLCWLIACADCDDAALKELGLDFIRFLYDPKNYTKQELNVSGLVEDKKFPWKQYFKTDVYFQANINGKVVSFIIEDKTSSMMHGDQLKRYAEGIKNDGL